MQHAVITKYVGELPNYVLPASDEIIPKQLREFDTVFSMGVLYHRASPIEHLLSLAGALRPGGELVLETLVVDEVEPNVLVPEDRYAKMRNVWFIPTPPMLQRWLHRTGFREIRVVDITRTNFDEQRATEWMQFESLRDFLDPNDLSLTIEGYPAPTRAIVTAIKP
jgi:tRNA (mo5U34)-methyltransferase